MRRPTICLLHFLRNSKRALGLWSLILTILSQATTITVLIVVLHHLFKIFFAFHFYELKNGGKGNIFISAYLTLYWWFTVYARLCGMGPPGVGCLQLPILIQINIDIESEYYSTCTTSTSNTIPFINVISSLTLLQIQRNPQHFLMLSNNYLILHSILFRNS